MSIMSDRWITQMAREHGMIEPYETPSDAAVREMWEETALYVQLTHVIGVFGERGAQGRLANCLTNFPRAVAGARRS